MLHIALVSTAVSHETLNKMYSSNTGLIVSAMSHSFQADFNAWNGSEAGHNSLEQGVPVWACPPDEETCTWHVKGARKYASASWISNDLFKDSGVRLYGCDSADCFTSHPGLLLVYNSSTTVIGAAFPFDAETDLDPKKGAEGTSKHFEPPACSEVYQICAGLHDVGTKPFHSCLRQNGSNLGDPYSDQFSDQFGGVPEGRIVFNSDFVNSDFVKTQKQIMGNPFQQNRLKPVCKNDETKDCTCGVGGTNSYENEVVIRTANPYTLYPEDSHAHEELRKNYTEWYCENQIPVAFAYVAGSAAKPWLSEYEHFLWYYQQQIKSICGNTWKAAATKAGKSAEEAKEHMHDKVPQLVSFNYTLWNGAPFEDRPIVKAQPQSAAPTWDSKVFLSTPSQTFLEAIIGVLVLVCICLLYKLHARKASDASKEDAPKTQEPVAEITV